jgi:hypothetical protein
MAGESSKPSHRQVATAVRARSLGYIPEKKRGSVGLRYSRGAELMPGTHQFPKRPPSDGVLVCGEGVVAARYKSSGVRRPCAGGSVRESQDGRHPRSSRRWLRHHRSRRTTSTSRVRSAARSSHVWSTATGTSSRTTTARRTRARTARNGSREGKLWECASVGSTGPAGRRLRRPRCTAQRQSATHHEQHAHEAKQGYSRPPLDHPRE